MNITIPEAIALNYLAHCYEKMDRIVPLEQHNSARRLRILHRLEEAGTFSEEESPLEWLKSKRLPALLRLREEARAELDNLLSSELDNIKTSDPLEWDFPSVANIYGDKLWTETGLRLAQRGTGQRLAELALDVLDLAGRQQELEHILEQGQ